MRASTKAHRRREFRRVPAEEFEVYVSSGFERHLPEELHVMLRGFPRKTVRAYWNGCAWVL